MTALTSAQKLAARALELVAALDGAASDPRRLVDAMRAVGDLRRLTDGVGVELAGRVDELWQSELGKPTVRALGERSPQMVVQIYAGVDAGEASAWVRVGAALRERVSLTGEVLPGAHSAIARALAEGGLRVDGAERVLRALEEIEPYSSLDERDGVEALLVAQAPELSDRQFAMLCNAVPARFEPENPERREAMLRARAGVQVRRGRDGLSRLIVTMHPEAEGFIMTALDARTSPRRVPTFSDPREAVVVDDPRPLWQTRLDALVSIARESLAHDKGHVAGTAVTLHVTMTLEALKTGLGCAKIAGVDEPITASTARRLAAAAEIIPVVLGSQSEPLDQGRAVRLATEPQRNAVAIRDGGCIWPKCEAPPGWCEVAHITPWAGGGSTDLDNLMLLCAFHHRSFDTGGWKLEHVDGERYLIPPPWIDSVPRRVYPAPAWGPADHAPAPVMSGS